MFDDCCIYKQSHSLIEYLMLNLPLISGPMRDFTLKTFKQLLQELKGNDYTFQTFRDFLKVPAPKAIVLRHDVDARKLNSLRTARLEAELGITGTYNFRMVPQSFDPDVIRQIASLGHEIGYHYEDLAMAAKKGRGTNYKRQGTRDKKQGKSKEEWLYDAAIRSFESNLEKLRQVAPVETICMHGSPLSKYDNRKMWDKYNYRDYGITGEPYLDLDFSKVLYLTDTGRRWDGERVSVRDKVIRRNGEGEKWRGGENKYYNLYHSTYEIVKAVQNGQFPDQIMINVHPQRWDDSALPWVKELVMQNVKNVVKRLLAK
jgi:hypothetical protein